MKQDFEPALHPIAIVRLRPTQMTVGYREVERKRVQWRKHIESDGADYLGRHMIPTVLGPGKKHFIIDHHHLVRALYEEKVEHVLVNCLADLSDVEKSLFWTYMDNRNWLHPYDASGKRHPHGAIPRTIADLKDDPYRSLAGELRRSGGYAKEPTPYTEFLWADFLRRQIDHAVVQKRFAKALLKAMALAHGSAASYLPGWCGPSE